MVGHETGGGDWSKTWGWPKTATDDGISNLKMGATSRPNLHAKRAEKIGVLQNCRILCYSYFGILGNLPSKKSFPQFSIFFVFLNFFRRHLPPSVNGVDALAPNYKITLEFSQLWQSCAIYCHITSPQKIEVINFDIRWLIVGSLCDERWRSKGAAVTGAKTVQRP